jgi:putative membrane protein
VLSLQAVERMRAQVFREREEGVAGGAAAAGDAAAAMGTAPRRLVELSIRELLLLGLLSNRGLALAAAAMGVFWQVAPDTDWLEGRIKSAIESVQEAPPSLPQTELLPAWVLAVGGTILLLLLLKLLSVAWIVLKYYGFTLTRRGDDLRAVYGLLTRVSATVPRRRIQVLSTHRGPLQRWLRRVSVQVETAGGREGDEGSGTERLWLAPQMPEEGLSALLAQVLPEIDFATLEWRTLEPRARWRVFRKTWRTVSLLVLAVTPLIWPWGLLLLLPVPLVALVQSTLYVRHTGYATNEHAVFYRSGWLRRRVSVVRFDKIQVVSLRQTPFDRWARMASLCVDTAGAGRIGHPVEINYLADDAAAGIFERLSGEAGRTAFRW